MKGKWKLGEPFGVGVYVHWTFGILVFLFLTGGSGFGLAGGLLFLAAVFGCVILHELGHSLAARRFGIGTRDITLYPIGGVASLERMPREPMQELVIALAGPAVNVIIAMALFPLVIFTQFLSVELAEFLVYVAWANVVLVVFNLLPAFPMDGGRVFRALLSMKKGRLEATNLAATVGKFMAVVLGLLGLFGGGATLVFIAVFVWFAGEAERRLVETESQSESAGFGFGRFSSVFPQFRHSVPPRQPAYQSPSGGGVRDVDWEVLPPERGGRPPGFGARW